MFNNRKSAFALLLVLTLISLRLFVYSTRSEKEEHQVAFRNDYRIYAFNLPDAINFSGEKVPLYDVEVAERLDRELLVNTYWQSQTLLFLKRSARYFPTIERVLKEEGIPEDFKYLAVIESGLSNVVSPSGAAGYWQFMEHTAREYGLEVNEDVDERYHLEKSTRAATKYLKDAYERYGNWTLAAASYNMGMSGVERRLEDQRVESYYDLALNSETARYVFRILAVKEILDEPKDYGFHAEEFNLYKPFNTRKVKVDTGIPDLVDFAHNQGITYKALKYFNPWMRNTMMRNSTGKAYYIDIPADKHVDTFFVNHLEQEELEAERQVVIDKASQDSMEAIVAEVVVEAEPVVYIVQRGETLSGIAKKHQVTVSELMKWNGLKKSNRLRIGQELKIFPQSVSKD